MFIKNIFLENYKIIDEVIDVKKKFEEEYKKRYEKKKIPSLYRTSDWARISFCFEYLLDTNKITSVLDVGSGPGALLNLLHKSTKFYPTTGIDIRHYSKLIKLYENIDLRIMDVGKMSFETNSFDKVICMEVLEHLDIKHFHLALSELRRVASKELFMTVPICEKEPISQYHKLRFTLDDIRKHFSHDAKLFILKPIKGMSWIVIIEKLT